MNQEIKERIELINKGIVPAGYKKTPVGICPVEWKTYKISDIAQVVGGGTPDTKNTDYFNGDINWFTPTEIGLTRYVSESKIKITAEGLKNSAAKIIPAGNILLTSRATIGEMSFNLVDCSTNQGFQSLIIKDPIVKNVVYFNNYQLKKQMLTYANGSTFLEISNKDVKKLKINISNKKEENSAIVKILDCATRQVELQEQIVDKLKVQKKALMQKLLTPQPDWQKLKLKNIINFYNGYSFKSETYVKNGAFYVITISNVKDDGFILQEDTSTIEKIPTDIRDYQILRKGDILISMTGNVGRVCKVECDNCLLNQRVGKIEVKKEFDKNFIFYSLQSYSFVEKMKLLAQGAAQDNMSVKDINNYIIYLPKNKEIQSNISNLLSNIDKRIELQQKLLEQYKLRQKSLMQLLLTGIVRVC